MKKTWWFIEPIDVLFFRDARNFTAGESHRARTLFPPYSSTVAGAIRSKILSGRVEFETFKTWTPNESLADRADEKLRLAVGTPTDYGKLQLKGPFLAQRTDKAAVEIYLPRPLDLFTSGILSPVVREPGLKGPLLDSLCNPPRLAPLKPKKEESSDQSAGHKAERKLLQGAQLSKYLAEEPCDAAIAEKDLYETEERRGLQLSEQRTAEEGMLYLAEFVRMKPSADGACGLLLEVGLPQDSYDLLRPGFISLGGRKRGAYCRPLVHLAANPWMPDAALGKIRDAIQNSGRFKLYLTTPALFQQGWLPDFLQETDGELRGNIIDGVEVRLVSAAVSKAVAVGGWDLAKGANGGPKPMYMAVPAGSVYYFQALCASELNGDRVNDILANFNLESGLQRRAGCGDMQRLAQIGFGLTLVGAWGQRE